MKLKYLNKMTLQVACVLSVGCASADREPLAEESSEHELTREACVLDALEVIVTPTSFLEKVFVRGKYYVYDGNQNWTLIQSGTLESQPHYQTVCNNKPAGTVCTFDTVTSNYDTATGVISEGIYAYGNWYSFNVSTLDGTPEATGTLESVARYAPTICGLKPEGTVCKFDTRTLYITPTIRYEAITAYGKIFNFDTNTGYTLVAGDPRNLEDVTRFQPICALKPAGSVCTFESREIYTKDSVFHERITAYGKYFNFDSAGMPLAGDPSGDLTTVYGDAPCAPSSE